MNRLRPIAALRAIALSAWMAAPVFAADRFYVGIVDSSSGNVDTWNNPASWSTTKGGPGGVSVPVAGDAVKLTTGNFPDAVWIKPPSIVGAGLASINIDAAHDSDTGLYQGLRTAPIDLGVAGTFHVDGDAALTGVGTYALSGGSVRVGGTTTVGDLGIGNFNVVNQAAASLEGDVVIGAQVNSSGTLFLENTASVTIGTETTGRTITLGRDLGSSGLIDLGTQGQTAVDVYGNLNVAPLGYGAILAYGGAFAVHATGATDGSIHLGGGADAFGTITTSKAFVVDRSIVVDRGGMFSQIGGSVHAANLIVDGPASELSTAFYDGSGGTLELTGTGVDGSIQVGRDADGYLRLSNTDVVAAGEVSIGTHSNSFGEIEQAGGTLTVGTAATPADLYVGKDGTGTWTLDEEPSGGFLPGATVNGNLFAGFNGNGVITQSAGDVVVTGPAGSGNLEIGAGPAAAPTDDSSGFAGVYEISGGSLSVSGELDVGGSTVASAGTGSFEISDAALSVGKVIRTWTNGTAYFSNASVTAAALDAGGDDDLAISGGTLSLSDRGVVGSVVIGHDAAGSIHLYNGAVLKAAGTINVGLNDQGDGFVQQDSGAVTSGTASIAGSGALYIGRYTGATGFYDLAQTPGTASTLTVYGNLYAGYLGDGTIQQNGGSVVCTGPANVGYVQIAAAGVDAVGAYMMNGGTLTATAGIDVGGDATAARGHGRFIMAGGTVNTDTVVVYETGVAELRGGTLNAAALRVGGTARSSGTFTFAGGALNAEAIALTGTAKLTIAEPGAARTLLTRSLSLTGNAARVDLTDNALVVDFTGADPSASIRALLLAGRNGGDWNGANGIVSSSVLGGATPVANDGVGFALASALAGTFPRSLNGVSFDATSVIVRYTLNGDTDLDGDVDFGDLVTLAQNYGASAATWARGDFDYDGSVGFNDLVSLAQNYNATVPAGSLEGVASAAFATDWALARSIVPEPTTLAAAAACLGILRRRRA